MKKTTLIPALMLALSSLWVNAQTQTVIDPAGAGGFELGEEFEDNGWLLNNASYCTRKWVVGTAQPGFTGERCAFIGATPTSVGTNAGGRTAHIYKQINIPEDAVNIQLKFKYKQEVVAVDNTGGPNDYIILSILDAAPTGTPSSSAQFGGKFPQSGTAPLATFTPFTVAVPETAATGTDKFLVITFKSTNLSVAGTVGWGAIDDIELTYEGTASSDEFALNGFSYFPNPVTDVLNLKYGKEMQKVTVTNMLGQQVMVQRLNGLEASVDMSGMAKGTYMVTVEADNSAKTFKIIK